MNHDDLLSRRPRTKRVFSDADMARLRDLYYDPHVPLIDAADAFGVPMSTLTRWIIEMRWPRKSTGWRPKGMAQPIPAREADAAPHPNPLPDPKSPAGDFGTQSAHVGNSRHANRERGR